MKTTIIRRRRVCVTHRLVTSRRPTTYPHRDWGIGRNPSTRWIKPRTVSQSHPFNPLPPLENFHDPDYNSLRTTLPKVADPCVSYSDYIRGKH